MALGTGQLLQDRYLIEARLGQGGMGTVYRATDLRFGAPVAIKENLQVTPEAQRQFGREAALLHQLRHPNLPRVSDHFVIPGQGQYLVMDFVEGMDLGQILAQQGGPVPEAQALAWVRGVLDALEYLHGRNVIHRDVKPANIKVTPEGRIILVDFGLAKVFDPSLATTIGARGVTPGYAPPEQYGMGRTDARTDVFSVGATLYSLLTGQRPPEALEIVTGAARLAPPSELRPRVSGAVEAAVLRAMQTRPADRFQSAAEFRRALDAVTARRAAGRPAGGVARPVGAAPQTLRSTLPTWFWPAAAGAAVLLVAIIAGVMALAGGRDGQSSPPPATLATQVVVASNTPQATRTPRTAEPPEPSASVSPEFEPTPQETAPVSPSPVDTTRPTITALPTRTASDTPTITTVPPTPTLVPPTNTMVPPTFTIPPPTSTPGPPSPTPVPQVRIAFMSDRSGNDEVWIMSADGSGLANLSNHPANDYGSAWSGDGSRILFGSDRDGNWEVYSMNSDGSRQTRLTNSPSYDHMASWSANGQRVCFASDRDGNLELYSMNADGSGVARLTNDPAVDAMPSWSPVGPRIAFMSGRNGDDEVWLMNADGSGLTNLTSHSGPDWGSAWSPDGARIAFASERDGNWEVYVINADGSGTARLTNHPASDQGPSWSPDGRKLAFVSNRDGNPEIYVMNSDGSGVTRLTDYGGRDESPTWSP